MMTRVPKRGRPKVLTDPVSLSFELDEAHRDHIDAYVQRFKVAHGVQIPRSAALRKIIEEHKQLTDKTETK